MSALAEIVQSEMPTPILFTDSAAAKVADLIAEEGNPELKLRVFVQGGGCSGRHRASPGHRTPPHRLSLIHISEPTRPY